MKKIILSLTLLAFTTIVFCQETTAPAFSKDYYLDKSKKQSTTAWVLLGCGTAAMVGGSIGFSNNFDIFSSSGDADAYGFLALAGLIADIGSIPVFISAAKNKGRAEVAIDTQKSYSLQTNLVRVKPIPALTFKVNF